MYGIGNPGAIAEGVSSTTEDLLTEMRKADDAETRYVAEALNEIAWGGEGMEHDHSLITSAEMIAQAATLFAERLKLA